MKYELKTSLGSPLHVCLRTHEQLNIGDEIRLFVNQIERNFTIIRKIYQIDTTAEYCQPDSEHMHYDDVIICIIQEVEE